MKDEYVDLGLPSGTLWASNIENGYFSYDEAVKKYGDNLPTAEQFYELIPNCMWEWDKSKNGYNVIGYNGNSIFLPAAGYRIFDGFVNNIGSYGSYWSSTPSDSSRAIHLAFYAGTMTMYSNYRCNGQSVILCKSKI